MKIATLAIFAAGDIFLSLLLRRLIFVRMTRNWQTWVAYLYTVFFSGLYFLLLGDNGFVAFEFDSFYSVGYWMLVTYSFGMIAFHWWASGFFHEHP
ncbi:hypothetical protein [Pseudomonas sp. NPDC089406]|uniref:hypothetical protein n=1 Tax=Pseudomonas sp. NPDC089406 TaxID=3364463 RepID=UPI00384F26E9